MAYGLRLSDDEIARYRSMADEAVRTEMDLWQQAGVVSGARILDVGCGPGAMLVALAEAVGPTGDVTGIDADEQALAAARTLLDETGITQARALFGRADATGQPEGSFDTVVIRHVLAHNGSSEQRIVDHLAQLTRPEGHVYLLDIDTSEIEQANQQEDLADLFEIYRRWHASKGNDLRTARRLAPMATSAGLTIVTTRTWRSESEIPAGARGAAWAARHSLVQAGFATDDDVTRWEHAFTLEDGQDSRPRWSGSLTAVVARRPR
ncbi:MAG: class I SAM-dependent methyltransferase [Actinomycetota bacterium]